MIARNRAEAEKAWENDKDFTDFIIPKLQAIISAGSCGETYSTQKDYFRIDATAWEQKRDASDVSRLPRSDQYHFQEYAWNLKTAVEHENDDRLWMDEVVKLGHIFCDLRVVIEYIPLGISHSEYIEFVSTRLNELNVSENMKHGEFLLLIGDTKCSTRSQWLHYTPYIYNGTQFVSRADWQV